MLDIICEPETNHLPFMPDAVSEIISEPATEPAAQQCFHQVTAGHRCNAPALRGEYFCRHHLKRARLVTPQNSPFEMPDITGRDSLRAAVLQIASRVAANSLDCRRAGILLYSLQIALSTYPPLPRPKPEAAKADAPSPTNAAGVEAWARIFLDRAEAGRTGAPDPFDQPLPRKDGVPHSCAVPPSGNAMGGNDATESGVPHSCAGVSPRMGGDRFDAADCEPSTARHAEPATNNEPATLPTLRACAANRSTAPSPSSRAKSRLAGRSRGACPERGEAEPNGTPAFVLLKGTISAVP